MAWCKKAISHYLNQCRPDSLTHICADWPATGARELNIIPWKFSCYLSNSSKSSARQLTWCGWMRLCVTRTQTVCALDSVHWTMHCVIFLPVLTFIAKIHFVSSQTDCIDCEQFWKHAIFFWMVEMHLAGGLSLNICWTRTITHSELN